MNAYTDRILVTIIETYQAYERNEAKNRQNGKDTDNESI
jgi:hypothetical protein